MTFPLMDRTRRLTEEALGEAGLTWRKLDGVLLVGGSTRMPMVRTLRLADGRQAAARRRERRRGRGAGGGDPGGNRGRQRRSATPCRGSRSRPARPGGAADLPVPARRVTDVMSHSLGTIAVSPDGSGYVNDIVIRRNVPIPASDTKSYLHATHGGANTAARGVRDAGRERLARWIARSWASMSSAGSSRPTTRWPWTSGCRTTPTASCRCGPPSATRATSCR